MTHRDIIGNYLNVGDEVVFAKSNSLHKGVIIAITPKMIRVRKNNSSWNSESLVYPSDCIIPGRMPP